jgi:putative chitinase
LTSPPISERPAPNDPQEDAVAEWTIRADALQHVCPNLSAADARRIADGLGEAFARFDITTPRRAAMAVAQWAHESDHFKTATEYASGDAYEGRQDLGNRQKGDGRRYKGRGRIQITGRVNYQAIAKALDIDCVNDPDLLAQSPYSELASGQWWQLHDCNAFCDRDDFLGLTKRINGGTNGLTARKQLYARALKVQAGLVPFDKWGVLTPDEHDRMTTLAAERRIAKRHGGWDKVAASHRHNASTAKDWLVSRRQELKTKAAAEPNGWARFKRRERYELIKEATQDR